MAARPVRVARMVAVATERKLAWIVLAILACTAVIGFGNGLRSALASPRTSLPGETAAAVLATGAAPRDATAATALDEARVHEIAREEADAAVARAKPAAPRKPKSTPVESPASDTPDAPIPYTSPASGAATAPASPQDPLSNPDRG